ncbi:MAG: hypothetical protein ABJG15_04950, partial [Hyphomonadaceae bacterium]
VLIEPDKPKPPKKRKPKKRKAKKAEAESTETQADAQTVEAGTPSPQDGATKPAPDLEPKVDIEPPSGVSAAPSIPQDTPQNAPEANAQPKPENG